MESTSKWKEGREVITCISLLPSNTTFTHSLSFTLMAKLKLEEGNNNNYKQSNNTTLNSGSAPTEDPWGVFINTRTKGAT